MKSSNVAIRRLQQMAAGVLVLLGAMLIASPDGDISGINIAISVLIFTVPGFWLLKEATEKYTDDVDLTETFSMMFVGAFVFLFVSLVVVSAFTFGIGSTTIGMVVVSFVMFFVPAAVVWLFNTGRRTETLDPMT